MAPRLSVLNVGVKPLSLGDAGVAMVISLEPPLNFEASIC